MTTIPATLLATSLILLALSSAAMAQDGDAGRNQQGLIAAPQNPVAPGAKPQKISADYKFTEGPAADREDHQHQKREDRIAGDHDRMPHPLGAPDGCRHLFRL